MSSPESPVATAAPSRRSNMPNMLSPKTPRQDYRNHRASSPNYFGLVVDSSSSSVRSAGFQPPKPGRSPSVHAAAAVTPHGVQLASNPEYDEFKKQLELNRLNISKASGPSSSPPDHRPQPGRTSSRELASAFSRRTGSRTPPKVPNTESLGTDELLVPRSPPKRLLSSDSADGPHRVRRQSPADFNNDHGTSRSLGSPPLRHQDRISAAPFAGPDSSPPGPGSTLGRTHSISTHVTPETPMMMSPQQIARTLAEQRDDVLLLDMRVATQYVHARIAGALNLCIPTTLLKRPSYNVQRLADTFKEDFQKAEFARWRSDRCIIVYDNASSQIAEAHSCVNILKKFASEGWRGQSLIVRGGFVDFSREFPDLVDDSPLGGGASSNSGEAPFRADALEIPPVMGGCPLPETESAANPFFGNIRQNMDLIGGVGQLPVKCPPLLSERDREDLPAWLRDAADERNQGKRVADKFLSIEKREKARMEEALSGSVVYDRPEPEKAGKVKVAGIEKGAKNRYHNIIPFEHSRVKLKGVPKDGCDYVNANFLNTSLSGKRYIATQSPIPATFADFWNVVWQRDIRVIVMLTAETEGNQIKAHNYWSAKRYGPIKLSLHSEHRASLEPQRFMRARARQLAAAQQRRFSYMATPSANDPAAEQVEESGGVSREEPFVVVRKFTVSHEAYPFERMREVTQLHYSDWPDFGVPTHPSHLLGLVEQCNSVVRASGGGSMGGAGDRQAAAAAAAQERPVLVHCSAGCGRTGTFCTVDTVVDALKHEGTEQRPGVDLVEKTVDEFRLQRLSMVQSLDQFVLCYETVLEWCAEQRQPPRTA